MNGVNLETADAQEIGITYEMMQVRKCMIYSQIVTVMSISISGAVSKSTFRSLFYKGFSIIFPIILLHEKFLQFDWLRAVVFPLNLKYPHVKITNLCG